MYNQQFNGLQVKHISGRISRKNIGKNPSGLSVNQG